MQDLKSSGIVRDIPNEQGKTVAETRTLAAIAEDIRASWPNLSPYAKPYVDAMAQLESVSDTYICEDGKSMVLYFLANAQSWRGNDARRVKAELRALIK